jgi:hypothetical protein
MYQHAKGVLSPRRKPQFYSKDETVDSPKMMVLFSWLHGIKSQSLASGLHVRSGLADCAALYWEEIFEDKMAGYLKSDSYGAFLPEELI